MKIIKYICKKIIEFAIFFFIIIFINNYITNINKINLNNLFINIFNIDINSNLFNNKKDNTIELLILDINELIIQQDSIKIQLRQLTNSNWTRRTDIITLQQKYELINKKCNTILEKLK